MKVRTERFRSAHGRKPYGRGTWVFRFDGWDAEFLTVNAAFHEARRAAVGEARRRGAGVVELMP